MKSLVLYAIIGSSALAVGAGGGVIYKRCIAEPKREYTGFNAEVCKPDGDALIKEIEKIGSKEKATEQFEAVDIANYAMEKYKRYENSVSFTTGTAHTVVEQEIRNVQIRNGNKYFEESISKSSMVGIGKRMYQEGLEGPVKFYNEKSKNDVAINGDKVSTVFKPNPDTIEVDEYKRLYGRNLPDMFIYCVHKITVVEGTCVKNGDGYKVTLDLNPDMGGYQYRYQMQTISGLSDLPTFQFINIVYELDENLDLTHIQVHEKYHATMGVSVDIENNLDSYYFPRMEYEIPDINQEVSYASLKEMIK